jgi:Icc-related predicted phosphoesterase
MELGLRDFVEVSYADESGQDHLGIMEINELFEDSQVTVDLHSHCIHCLPLFSKIVYAVPLSWHL